MEKIGNSRKDQIAAALKKAAHELEAEGLSMSPASVTQKAARDNPHLGISVLPNRKQRRRLGK